MFSHFFQKDVKINDALPKDERTRDADDQICRIFKKDDFVNTLKSKFMQCWNDKGMTQTSADNTWTAWKGNVLKLRYMSATLLLETLGAYRKLELSGQEKQLRTWKDLCLKGEEKSAVSF